MGSNLSAHATIDLFSPKIDLGSGNPNGENCRIYTAIRSPIASRDPNYIFTDYPVIDLTKPSLMILIEISLTNQEFIINYIIDDVVYSCAIDKTDGSVPAFDRFALTITTNLNKPIIINGVEYPKECRTILYTMPYPEISST